MDDWVYFESDPDHIARERNKARDLRRSGWWKNQLAKGICHYCGGKFPPGELTMDHLVPVARGGRSARGNVVVACRQCNAAKSCLTPVELAMREMPGFDPGSPDES